MNIYLIGMMGSGKTATGEALAKQRHATLIDLDEALEKKLGRKIADIFAKEGEPFFRQEESKILTEISKRKDVVVATGGGIVLHPENIALMKATGRIIYLKTSLEWLWKRVQGQGHRPLLNKPDPKAALNEILEKRKCLYEGACDAEVITDGKTPGQVAQEILNEVKPS